MRNEVLQKNVPDGYDQLNYRELFRKFVQLRKIKLLRYLFSLKIEFEFSVGIFLIALEEDAYDIAVLLHKEFAYLMRENSFEENRQIVTNVVLSMNKANKGSGMIDAKIYLLKEYMDYFQLRHARSLLDYIDKKGTLPTK